MQPNTLDLNTITDVKELKSMAYDQLALKQQCEQNLEAINIRLAQVMNGEQPPKGEGTPEPTGDEDSSSDEQHDEGGDQPTNPEA